MTQIFLWACLQTVLMVLIGGGIAVVLGIPLGILLFVLRPGHILASPVAHKILGIIVNILRSVPFIILLVFIIPFTRLLVGSSIGTAAAIVPLALSALPFVARVAENAISEVGAGLLEASEAMGATPWQTIYKFLLPEAMPSMIRGITLMLIALVGYSAMAGAVGGGGLGNLAIQYGYDQFNTEVMLTTICVLIVLVQCLQWAGDLIVKKLVH